MIEEYVFQLTSANHRNWKYLREEFLDDDSMSLDEAARTEFSLFIETAPTLFNEPLESVTMYGYKNSMCIGVIAHHDFKAA